ncbi:ATP phosphoribosyltransferase regulatory subunit [Gynuella sp.]|uniref:ATP phosphoribosyltransferase regulatory subunit n=1 Tax=Gynuella sp. TaxID=2969146 RepID=UPI003D13080D
MSKIDRWILPDGIEEILPPEANQIEHLRRNILDQFALWGYRLVIPPQAEYLESLLTGIGHDLDLLTFKLTDQMTGRMMGLSADRSQQVARMDAHSIQTNGPARYCYSSPIVHTRPAHLQASRSPIQIGAELYGVKDICSDIEIVCLMLTALKHIGISDITLDLGHVAIYRTVVNDIGLNHETEAELYKILRQRSLPELDAFLAQHLSQYPLLENIRTLSGLSGDESVLDTAITTLSSISPSIEEYIKPLQTLAQEIQQEFPIVNLHFDLAELRDYNYHTGLIFSVFVDGLAQPIAKGGRYDNTGQVFGRARPATGFSADLKTLVKIAPAVSSEGCIFAPADPDPQLKKRIRELRQSGHKVVQALTVDDTPETTGCSQKLSFSSNTWAVTNI